MVSAADRPPPTGAPVTEGATPGAAATSPGGGDRWGDERGLLFADEDNTGTAGSDPEAATPAREAVDEAEIDDLAQATRSEHHDITAEVPVTPPVQGSSDR